MSWLKDLRDRMRGPIDLADVVRGDPKAVEEYAKMAYCKHLNLQHGKDHWGADEPFTACYDCGKQWDGHLKSDEAVRLSPREHMRPDRAAKAPTLSELEEQVEAEARLDRARDKLLLEIGRTMVGRQSQLGLAVENMDLAMKGTIDT